MARDVKDAKIGTRTARRDLAPAAKPYYRALDTGLHLGYRKGKRGGKWVMRWYAGKGDYRMEVIGQADDHQDADGETVLDFSQAQRRARELYPQRLAELEGRTYRKGAYTVRDALQDYHQHLETHGKTARDSRSRAETLILPELGEVETAKLTASMIRRWHEGLAKAPARARRAKGEDGVKYRKETSDDPEAERRRKATANRMLAILKAGLNHAWREGMISSDDAWRRVQPFKNVDAARVRYLDLDEAQRLINACEPAFRALVRGALFTGMRYGELTALQVQDFNRDAAAVHVRASKSGKGRHVYLNADGVAFFEQVTAGRKGGELMFAKADGSQWGRTHQKRPLKAACERAGIDPPITFHELRHSYASHAIMAGAPLMVVAENLGHADTRMVEKHYGHLAQSYVADTIRKTAPSFGTEPSNVERLRSAG